MCPSADQVCMGGTCYNPDQFLPDAGIEQHVTTGGGGGCNTGGDASGCRPLSAWRTCAPPAAKGGAQ